MRTLIGSRAFSSLIEGCAKRLHYINRTWRTHMTGAAQSKARVIKVQKSHDLPVANANSSSAVPLGC
jgi:hypothetical protein